MKKVNKEYHKKIKTRLLIADAMWTSEAQKKQLKRKKIVRLLCTGCFVPVASGQLKAH